MAIEHRKDALQAGVTLHSYRIIEVLGSGAFGITYLAEHNLLNTRHVIKEYLPDSALRDHESATVTPKSSSDSELFRWGLDSFFQEARFVHELSHSNIVKVSDLFEANGTAYFVMPFLDGITLHEWIKQNPQPSQDKLLEIFVPILEGLKYIHQKGLLHRDIKPENIYITDNGNPVLIDFGAARLAIGEKSRALTQVLTPHFAPWEQYRSKGDFTPALDFYSLAACMFQAITGDMPEEAPNRLEHDPVEPLAQRESLTQIYSVAFLQAVDKALSVKAPDRFQDAFSYQLALMEHDAPQADSAPKTIAATRDEADPVTPDGIVPDAPLTSRVSSSSGNKETTAIPKKKSKLPALLSIVILLAAAGGGYWYWDNHLKDTTDVEVTDTSVESSDTDNESTTTGDANSDPQAEEDERTEQVARQEDEENNSTQAENSSSVNTELAENESVDENAVSEAQREANLERQQREQDDNLWSAAVEQNTVSAFNEYVESCQLCEQQEQAQQNIEELEAAAQRAEALAADQRLWNVAGVQGTEQSYQEYIDSCQICEQRDAARAQINEIEEQRLTEADNALWATASRQASEQSYSRYLEQCDKCAYQSQAQREFNRLRDQRVAMEQALEQEMREQSAWDYASGTNTIVAYQDYLDNCVNCANKEEANQAIDLLSRLGDRITVGVDQDFSSIQEAIDAAEPGATIEVYPGEYSESVRLYKDVSLTGVSSGQDITIIGQSSYALHVRADNANVSNLTIRQLEGPNSIFAVLIDSGDSVLDGLDIRSTSGAAVAIRSGANPTLQNSEIHSGTQTGIFVFDGGKGVIRNNRVHGHELANIEIRDANSTPVIQNNEIFQSQYSGIYIHNGAGGEIRSNDIRNNRMAGVYLTRSDNVLVSDNAIFDNEEEGVVFTESAQGELRANRIYRNERAGVSVSNQAAPTVVNNEIYQGNASGIFVYDNASGTFRDNTIYEHRLSNVVVTTMANPTFRNNQIHSSQQVGVFVYENGRGNFIENEIYENSIANSEIKGASSVNYRNNTFRDSEVGIYLHEGGTGEFSDNKIQNNTVVGIALASDGNPTFQNNEITNNLDGVAAYPRSRGVFRGNEVRQNQGRDWAIAQGANINRR